MVLKRAFEMLKGRWRILLKNINMSLHSIPGKITARLCLYNLCLIHADEFDINRTINVEKELKKTYLQNFGDFRDVDLFYMLESGISEMMNIQIEVV